MPAARADYEEAVRAIAGWASAELSRGVSVEQVARGAVERRNELKQRFRAGVPADILRLIEARNQAKYGDPVGPNADQLLARYGDWTQVVAAASRHARLAGS